MTTAGFLGFLSTFDIPLNMFFASVRSPWFNLFFLDVAWWGNTKTVIGIIVLLTVFLCLIKKHQSSIVIILVSAGAAGTTELIKHLVGRARPMLALYTEPGYSFPSGHATIAVALYGTLGLLLYRHVKNRVHKFVIACAAILVIFMLGFSRIYLGVHYFTDVLAGYFVGAVWLAAGYWFIRSKKKTPKQN